MCYQWSGAKAPLCNRQLGDVVLWYYLLKLNVGSCVVVSPSSTSYSRSINTACKRLGRSTVFSTFLINSSNVSSSYKHRYLQKEHPFPLPFTLNVILAPLNSSTATSIRNNLRSARRLSTILWNLRRSMVLIKVVPRRLIFREFTRYSDCEVN